MFRPYRPYQVICDLRSAILSLIDAIEIKSWYETHDYSSGSRKVSEAMGEARQVLRSSEQSLSNIQPTRLCEADWVESELNSNPKNWMESMLSNGVDIDKLEDSELKGALTLWLALHKSIEKNLEENGYCPITLKEEF